jgi:aryl-alcohol dehydrogenase-like predicted oxidoreductase
LVEALQLMKAQGKVRWIGISSTLPHLDAFIKWGVFDTFQIPYSALDRTHEEAIQRAHDSGAGVIIRGGVSGGKLGTEVAANDQRTLWEKARLDELLGEGESRTQFLQRFTNTHPGMHTNIVGTKNLSHLLDNVTAAARGPLSPEICAEAKKRLSWVA